MDRRNFLKKTLSIPAALSIGELALASQGDSHSQQDQQYDFQMARVQFPSAQGYRNFWSVYPGADANLLREFSMVVRCRVKLQRGCRDVYPTFGQSDQFNCVVDLTNPQILSEYPFLFMTSEYDFRLSDNQKQNLRNYIHQGGFLLMDDCVVGGSGDFFYRSGERVLRELFGKDVRIVSPGHEVFHNVFDFGKKGLPFIQGQPHKPLGVFIEDRLAVFLSPTDLHCGWAGCFGTNSNKYAESIKMGINIIMYSISH